MIFYENFCCKYLIYTFTHFPLNIFPFFSWKYFPTFTLPPSLCEDLLVLTANNQVGKQLRQGRRAHLVDNRRYPSVSSRICTALSCPNGPNSVLRTLRTERPLKRAFGTPEPRGLSTTTATVCATFTCYCDHRPIHVLSSCCNQLICWAAARFVVRDECQFILVCWCCRLTWYTVFVSW